MKSCLRSGRTRLLPSRTDAKFSKLTQHNATWVTNDSVDSWLSSSEGCVSRVTPTLRWVMWRIAALRKYLQVRRSCLMWSASRKDSIRSSNSGGSSRSRSLHARQPNHGHEPVRSCCECHPCSIASTATIEEAGITACPQRQKYAHGAPKACPTWPAQGANSTEEEARVFISLLDSSG